MDRYWSQGGLANLHALINWIRAYMQIDGEDVFNMDIRVVYEVEQELKIR